MTATDRDRETAAKVLADVHSGWCAASPGQAVAHPCHCRLKGRADAFAAALSAERARVLAPVLAVAEALEETARSRRVLALDAEAAGASEESVFLLDRADDEWAQADRIRRAAQDGEPE